MDFVGEIVLAKIQRMLSAEITLGKPRHIITHKEAIED
jgi:hypothetical protein